MIAVFLDRDGTIGGTGGGMHPFEFSMYDFAPTAIKVLNDMGVKVFLFTNQSRVARGYFTEEELLEGFSLMEVTLKWNEAFLDGIYYCPHQPDDKCECHKPSIGLLLKAQIEHNLDLSKCYVVGDTGSSDMLAASKVGAKMVLVRTGWGEYSLGKFRDTWAEIEPNHIAENLVGAVTWIVNDIEYNNHT